MILLGWHAQLTVCLPRLMLCSGARIVRFDHATRSRAYRLQALVVLRAMDACACACGAREMSGVSDSALCPCMIQA